VVVVLVTVADWRIVHEGRVAPFFLSSLPRPPLPWGDHGDTLVESANDAERARMTPGARGNIKSACRIEQRAGRQEEDGGGEERRGEERERGEGERE